MSSMNRKRTFTIRGIIMNRTLRTYALVLALTATACVTAMDDKGKQPKEQPAAQQEQQSLRSRFAQSLYSAYAGAKNGASSFASSVAAATKASPKVETTTEGQASSSQTAAQPTIPTTKKEALLALADVLDDGTTLVGGIKKLSINAGAALCRRLGVDFHNGTVICSNVLGYSLSLTRTSIFVADKGTMMVNLSTDKFEMDFMKVAKAASQQFASLLKTKFDLDDSDEMVAAGLLLKIMKALYNQYYIEVVAEEPSLL